MVFLHPHCLEVQADHPLLNDPRDRPLLVLIIVASVAILPFAAVLYTPGMFTWPLGLLYLTMISAVFLDRLILMLHNTSHRPLFKYRYRWLNNYVPWVLGPFFGETPESFFAHHVGMHHVEENLLADLVATMPYQRDRAPTSSATSSDSSRGASPSWWPTSPARGASSCARAPQVGRRSTGLSWRDCSFVNWRATVVVFVCPMVAVRFLMMAGNWGQHAFVDAADPRGTLSKQHHMLSPRYNRRCFNDGYHIGHHVKATRHWSEMPADFESNREQYARERAIVFKDIDYFGVWWLLMWRSYGRLARHYVALAEPRPSEGEIIALLRDRVRAFPRGLNQAQA